MDGGNVGIAESPRAASIQQADFIFYEGRAKEDVTPWKLLNKLNLSIQADASITTY